MYKKFCDSCRAFSDRGYMTGCKTLPHEYFPTCEILLKKVWQQL